MVIISLFDGISCAKVSLDNLNIKYDKYYAYEIDKYAISVSDNNHIDVIRMGDVCNIETETITEDVIDLLVAGSPCQSFSDSGNRNGFDGKSGLIEYFFIALEKYKPKYFLIENVEMKTEWLDEITKRICEIRKEDIRPLFINSKHFSAQNRPRVYWTNIINQEYLDTNLPSISPTLKDIIDITIPFDKEPYGEKFKSSIPVLYTKEKFHTVRSEGGSRTKGIAICDDDGKWRHLTMVELEKLQVLPINYTIGVSNKQRRKSIGNGFTVSVIEFIFRNIL